MNSVYTIEALLALNYEKNFSCEDVAVKRPENEKVYGIGNAYLMDHVLTCRIPKELRHRTGCDKVELNIHIVLPRTSTAYRYSGIVVDKADCKLYFADVYTGDSDSDGECSFAPATEADLQAWTEKTNCYLKNVIELSKTNPRALLDYQLYSIFSERFYYIEIPFEDRVVMCGVGLHTNKFWAVGWLGKLINKNFFVSLAECSFEAYETLKRQSPCLFDRGQQMEKNRHLFSYFHVMVDKQRKHKQFVELLTQRQKEPLSTRPASVFYASPFGTAMTEYNGPAYRWMEDFLIQIRRIMPPV